MAPVVCCSSQCTGYRLRTAKGRPAIRGRLRVVRPEAAALSEAGSRFNVLITGSTKGIGRAMAAEFVRAGDNVVISSRTERRVKSTVDELQQLADQVGKGSTVYGLAANVAVGADVAALADFAAEQLGNVDVWVNNAGSNAYKFDLLAEASAEDLQEIVQTNVLGVMLCCKEAIRIMRKQQRGGHVFNMDGAGADGSPTPRFAAYGATKRGLEQLSKSLQAELKMLEVNNVGIHNLSPGMVTTDLLMAGANTPTARFFINCLAETPEHVAQYLVPRIRQVPMESAGRAGGAVKQGTYIKYLTLPKAYSQIAGRLLLGQRRGRFVPED